MSNFVGLNGIFDDVRYDVSSTWRCCIVGL